MRLRPTRSARSPRRRNYLVAAVVPALIVVLSITGFVWAQTEVTVTVDGSPRNIKTQAADVAGALADAGVAVGESDLVTPALTDSIRSGMSIVVRRAVPVTLELGSEPVELKVVGETVADALVAAGIDPSGIPGVTPDLTSPLAAEMTISVPDVVVKVEREESPIAAGVKHTKDASLASGTTRVVDEGAPGTLLRVYRVMIVDGVESAPMLTAEQVVVEPRPKVIAEGNASPKVIAVSAKPTQASSSKSAATKRPSGKSLRVTTTGYSAEQPGLNSTTATGAAARYGVVAVDPDFIPLGTRLFIPGYGEAVAADTGSGVKGAHVDLCFDTVAEARQWGRRSVTIVILD